MYGANLSWQPLKKILNSMVSNAIILEIESGERGDKRTKKTYQLTQKGENVLWDLWQLFRETMVAHYVKDMVAIARESGFARSHYYTHQIPADYLFGTRPNDPAIPYLNPRYYSSASPLWTANPYDDTGVGVTMYDINFGTWYARTSKYILSDF